MNDREALARDAIRRGLDALGTKNFCVARRWFDRARRIVPGEPSVALLLASASAGSDKQEANRLLQDVLQSHPDFSPARLALVAMRLSLRDPQSAADLLHTHLSHAAPPREQAFHDLARRVAEQSGRAGWIGLNYEGHIAWWATQPSKVLIHLDGAQLTPPESDGHAVWTLPESWRKCGVLTATADGEHLIGSPIQLCSLRASDGFVEWTAEGDLRGWAWSVVDIDAKPRLVVTGNACTALTVTACDGHAHPVLSVGIARPRYFEVARCALPPQGSIRVCGLDGIDLVGSPLPAGNVAPAVVECDSMKSRKKLGGPSRSPQTPRHSLERGSMNDGGSGGDGSSPPVSLRHDRSNIGPTTSSEKPLGEVSLSGSKRKQRRPIDIVILATEYRSGVSTQVASVIRNAPHESRTIIVTKIADPDAVGHAHASIITLLVPEHAGTPEAANLGISHSLNTGNGPRDIVLLKGSATPPDGWLRRLARSAYARADIGSVSALNMRGTLACYSDPTADATNVASLDSASFAAANSGYLVELPAATGNCIYFKHDCIATIDPFREDLFAQGGGEEIEWSMRARSLGWRHMADPAVFVDSANGAAIAGARSLLLARNMALIEQLHPGTNSTLSSFRAADPLAASRRRVDSHRWSRARSRKGAAILITHGRGGGVTRFVRERADAIRALGLRPIIITPEPGQSSQAKSPKRCVLADDECTFSNLIFDTDHALHELAAFLGPDKPVHVEIHHLLGHSPAIAGLPSQLGIDFDLYVHDYALICRRITLYGRRGEYCGQPPSTFVCDECTRDLGDRLQEEVSTAALRTRSAHLVRLARSVYVPTHDVAERFGRYVSCAGKLVVQPWEDDERAFAVARPTWSGKTGADMRVCVVGAIGKDKGIDVLLGCASDAARRRLPIHFTVVGHTTDDAGLIDTGHAFVTGEYGEDEAVALITEHQCTIGFLPSVWPETWCYSLTHLWRARLWPVAFDLGSPATRIVQRGIGTLIPLSLSPPEINDFLLALPGQGHLNTDRPRL